MNITSVLRKLFIARQRELAHYTYEAEKLQHDVLMRLVEQAKDTEYGRKHLFAAIKGYDDFAKNVPVNTYEELKGDIERIRHGEADVLWSAHYRYTPQKCLNIHPIDTHSFPDGITVKKQIH